MHDWFKQNKGVNLMHIQIRNECENYFKQVEELTREAFGIIMYRAAMNIIWSMSCEVTRILYTSSILQQLQMIKQSEISCIRSRVLSMKTICAFLHGFFSKLWAMGYGRGVQAQLRSPFLKSYSLSPIAEHVSAHNFPNYMMADGYESELSKRLLLKIL